MKQVLSYVLIALVASMVVGLPTAFADSRLDSLVNIATKAREQVKIQLVKAPNVSDELRAQFKQGSQETELLISAVKQGDVAQAKQHFLAAMKIFKQVSVDLSEPQQDTTSLKAAQTLQVDPSILINYKNSIDRVEKYVTMLKGLAAKSGFSIDFTKVDGLIQNARSSLAANDTSTLERILVELKSALNDVQNAIKDQTVSRTKDKVQEFVSKHITRIEARLGELESNIDDTIKPKFEVAKEIMTQLKNAGSVDEAVKLLRQLDSTIKEIENYVQSKQVLATNIQEAEIKESRPAEIKELRPAEPPLDKKPTIESKQERAKQREVEKIQRISAEMLRLEARLGELKPYVDENIKPKFERAESLLFKLKDQDTTNVEDYLRTVRMLDLLIDGMEQYVESLQNKEAETSSDEDSEDTEDSKINREKVRPSEKEKRHSVRDN